MEIRREAQVLRGREMTREIAYEILEERIRTIDGFQGVPISEARALIGPDNTETMLKDPIRGIVFRPGYLYPWNVVDYMTTLGTA